MKRSKKYYKYLDYVRVLALFAVLLYHLNILKGGYLAVCIFFTLSGYLSVISLAKNKDFSFKKYYSKLFSRIYLPLLIVTFITIAVVSFFPNISWLNLKPETKSVLFGYNNFWQLTANLDYFARHINSPFMHLWYIAILLQFDIIFPFIFILFSKIKDKFNKLIPCLVSTIFSIIGFIYFYVSYLTTNIMTTYYSTFSRIFSLLFGISIGFIHLYYKQKIISSLKRHKKYNNTIFYTYILLLICLFIFVNSKSIFMPISMILTTLITCRLIDYSIYNKNKNLNALDKIIKFLSNISYEVYLVQYPIIFILQYLKLSLFINIIVVFISVFFISYLLHSITKRNTKYIVIRRILYLIVLSISFYGIYIYINAKDYTNEMKKLEEQLSQNQKIIEEKQKEYNDKLKHDEEVFKKELSSYDLDEEQLREIITNLSVVGVGDSVMLGAVENLYEQFPNGYFDAQISRTAWIVNDILLDLKNKNALGDVVILNLGANGDCSFECKEKIIKTCQDRDVFWVNVTNDNNVNENLSNFASKYEKVHIIDWKNISNDHPEYFYADGIHLTPSGRKAYTNAIYDSIYDLYLKRYKEEKEKKIREHDEYLKRKISFYGNDLMLNLFDYVKNEFNDSIYNINKEFNYEKIKTELEAEINNNTLTEKIVFAFDNTSNLSIEQYSKLIELCKNYQIYILSTNETTNELINLNYNNVYIIDFYKQLKLNNDYILIDGIHLSNKGNLALSKTLNDYLKNSES